MKNIKSNNTKTTRTHTWTLLGKDHGEVLFQRHRATYPSQDEGKGAWELDGLVEMNFVEALAGGYLTEEELDSAKEIEIQSFTDRNQWHIESAPEAVRGEVAALVDRLEETNDGKRPNPSGTNCVVRGQERKRIKAKINALKE